MSTNGDGFKVKFRELVLPSVAGNPTFKIQDTLAINPGNPLCFPWLSTIAKNYEQYSVGEMRFEYVNSAAATTSGFLYMVADYDVYDSIPQTAQEMMNQYKAVSTPVWAGISMPINPRAAMGLGTRRWVRPGGLVSARDLSLTDVGKVHIASDQAPAVASLGLTNQASVTIGQLWISYAITFYTPQTVPSVRMTRSVAALDPVQTFDFDGNGTITGTGVRFVDMGSSFDNTNVLGIKTMRLNFANHFGYPQGGATSYCFPPGFYEVSAQVNGRVHLTREAGADGSTIFNDNGLSFYMADLPKGEMPNTSTIFMPMPVTAGSYPWPAGGQNGQMVLASNSFELPTNQNGILRSIHLAGKFIHKVGTAINRWIIPLVINNAIGGGIPGALASTLQSLVGSFITNRA